MGWLSDIGDAVSSVASTVGNAVEDAVDAVADTAEDGVDFILDNAHAGIEWGTDWVCKNGPGGIAGDITCGAANVVGGILDGAVQGLQDHLHNAFDLFRDVGHLVGSVLRLDLQGALKDLGELLLDIGDFFVDLTRFLSGGYFVGGIIKKFRRSLLIEFVESELPRRILDPQLLAAARRNIGLEDGRFGLRLPSQHRVFMMDSKNVDLWRMHQQGVIDLYAMAGLLSFDSFPLLGTAHPDTVVRSVDSDGNENAWPVSRWTISKYLESKGEEKRLRVYSMSRRSVAQMLSTASRKLDEIGVILQWNDGESFSWFRDYTRQEIKEIADISSPGGPPEFSIDDLYNFNSAELEKLLKHDEYHRPPGVNCELLALAAFKLDRGTTGKNGRVGARDISQCDEFPSNCVNPERTDQCCVSVRRCQSSGVIYLERYPRDFFQYILPHEIGHYLGLCHCNHGPESVMWVPPWTDDSTKYIDWGILSYYWESEPHFSLEDGKNSWRFIINQLADCLTGRSELHSLVDPVPVDGDASCPPGTYELRIEPVSDGKYPAPGDSNYLTATINVSDTEDGPVIDFALTRLPIDNYRIEIAAVIVKAGGSSNVYTYQPDVSCDINLHAPLNPQNGKFLDPVCISFCYQVVPATDGPIEIKAFRAGDTCAVPG